MKERFETYRFSEQVASRILLASQILTEYRAAGYTLTIRQLYYQMVARGYIENTMQSYKRIVADMTKARYAGLVDWNAIEDRTRQTMSPVAWDNHVDILKAAASGFRLDRWEGQNNHVEIFIEKEALAGVFQPLVRELHVHITANRGYSSASEMWRHAKRFQRLRHQEGKRLYLFYFGDHDPSGMDMDRDMIERIQLLSRQCFFQFHRLALTWDQIEHYSPPPNPAKLTDSRAGSYVAEFGFDSWELDALEPQVLTQLAREAILDLRDDDAWNSVLAIEEEMRERLEVFAETETEQWDDLFGDTWSHGPEG